jgi:hypothetical protein
VVDGHWSVFEHAVTARLGCLRSFHISRSSLAVLILDVSRRYEYGEKRLLEASDPVVILMFFDTVRKILRRVDDETEVH